MSEELNKLGAQMQKLGKELPQVMGAFMKLDQECVKDGVLSNKVKELIAVGIAVTIKCKYCIRFHVAEAVKAGANRAEILEAAGVSIFMGGGPAVTFAASVLLDELDKLGVK